MGNKQDRNMILSVQCFQKSHNLGISLIILACSRLIQNDDFRLQCQNGSNRHTFSLSVAEYTHRPVAHAVQVTHFECLFHPPVDLFPGKIIEYKSQFYFIPDHILYQHLVWILHDVSDLSADFLNSKRQIIHSLDHDAAGHRPDDPT